MTILFFSFFFVQNLAGIIVPSGKGFETYLYLLIPVKPIKIVLVNKELPGCSILFGLMVMACEPFFCT